MQRNCRGAGFFRRFRSLRRSQISLRKAQAHLYRNGTGACRADSRGNDIADLFGDMTEGTGGDALGFGDSMFDDDDDQDVDPDLGADEDGMTEIDGEALLLGEFDDEDEQND